jgi:hypothetical protein
MLLNVGFRRRTGSDDGASCQRTPSRIVGRNCRVPPPGRPHRSALGAISRTPRWRLQVGKLATVYAYRSELDKWFLEHQPKPEAEDSQSESATGEDVSAELAAFAPGEEPAGSNRAKSFLDHPDDVPHPSDTKTPSQSPMSRPLFAQSAAADDLLGSISMRPLNCAPSSMVIRAVAMSPTTEPSFFTSTRSRAWRFPITFP